MERQPKYRIQEAERRGEPEYLFDILRFSIIPRLSYWMDGRPGKRTLFIADEEERVTISFEEGKRCLDLLEPDAVSSVEHRQGSRYLHQNRADPMGRCAYFHMELTDPAGRVYHLPGQMIARNGYLWADGVEPVLVALLNSIVLTDTDTTVA